VDEVYVTSALVTTCGSSRVHFGGSSPLTDATARERALGQAQARGALQEAFAERLLADPPQVRARVRDTLVTFIPTVFGSPHLVAVHAPGWHPVVQYPVAAPSAPEPVSLDAIERRLGALAHPARLRLVRTLARGPHTTSELAHA
jgi:hypothetical protein